MGESDAVRTWRSEFAGGTGILSVDWNLMTEVPGLFCAGEVCGAGSANGSGSTGFYAGNRAAEFAAGVSLGEVDAAQLETERSRVYAPIERAGKSGAYVSWKELWAGTARVMQQECAEVGDMTVPILKHGLLWLDSIKKSEMQKTYARNPHELARVLECETRVTCSEVVLNACIAVLEAADKGIRGRETVLINQMVDGEFVTTYKKGKFWIEPPYAPSCLENYELCRKAEKEVY
jgi:succinate dehydrogenase/fumarate reductase flavoprotein subunit